MARVTWLAVVVALSLGSPRADAQVIAAWRFDEAGGSVAAPAAGSVSGTLAGDAAFVPGGISGGAVSMSQAGAGLVDMGNNFAFNGPSTFSLVAWFKTNPGDSSGMLVAGRHQSTVLAGYFLGINNTSSGSGEVAGGGIFYQSYPNPVSGNLGINNGSWHQLVAVHDFANNQARLYVDGILRDTRSHNSFGLSAANFAVGGILNAAGNQMIGTFTGLADEVSIWGQALTDSDVQFLFNNPGALVVPEPASFALVGLAAAAAGVMRRRKSTVASLET
jgi:hypothetical protein